MRSAGLKHTTQDHFTSSKYNTIRVRLRFVVALLLLARCVFGAEPTAVFAAIAPTSVDRREHGAVVEQSTLAVSGTVTGVSAGGAHTCIVVNGGAKCWGRNANGQLGNGNKVDSAVLQSVSTLGNSVVAIDAGADHTCALISDGSVHCWGPKFLWATG